MGSNFAYGQHWLDLRSIVLFQMGCKQLSFSQSLLNVSLCYCDTVSEMEPFITSRNIACHSVVQKVHDYSVDKISVWRQSGHCSQGVIVNVLSCMGRQIPGLHTEEDRNIRTGSQKLFPCISCPHDLSIFPLKLYLLILSYFHASTEQFQIQTAPCAKSNHHPMGSAFQYGN